VPDPHTPEPEPASTSGVDSGALDELEATIRDRVLGFPGAHEDHPWGDTVFKAGAKVFVFFGRGDNGVHLGLKLPRSFEDALAMPGARPSAYGLGRHGWVSLEVRPNGEPKLDLLEPWLEESFRATAPKGLVRQLDEQAGEAGQTPTPATMPTPRPPA
jgi:predicted DNA-binding protein (MmcQ/YjbR family)